MAAERARESARPDRLFYDPLARRLAGADGVELMARMEAGLPANPTLSIRTRFFDDTHPRPVRPPDWPSRDAGSGHGHTGIPNEPSHRVRDRPP